MAETELKAASEALPGLPPKKNYILDAWLVIALAVVFGCGLAGLQLALGPRIAENKRQETFQQIPALVPGADPSKVEEKTIDVDGQNTRVYKVADQAGAHIGWVVPAAGQGFGDRIELLVGLDAKAEKVTGLFVLDQKETPGLGDFITDAGKFRNQFEGLPASKGLVAKKASPNKDQGEIQALTGATISSQSVCDIISTTLKGVGPKLAGGL